MRSGLHVAIVGAGQAAARTIAAMRKAGYAGGITLVGDERELPYERPPLSKESLFGAGEPQAATIFDEAYYRAQGVELALGETVDAIEPNSGTVRLANSRKLQADRIVLATGARARRAALPGVDGERIVTLRSLADTRRLRPLLTPGRRLTLLGGGFIGLEIAAGAARLGCAVTVIEARPRLIERAVSARVSALVQALHATHGVSFRLPCIVTGARQGRDETELQLSDGSTVTADVIVAGIGAEPNDALARAAGLACGNGIEVDGDCRTSADTVWAVGDVAARLHPSWGRRVRIESWDNAESHAARAGRAIAASWVAGGDRPTDEPEAPAWFWTDQYELNLQILGSVTDSDQTVSRTDRHGVESLIFHFRDRRLRGAELISAGRERPFAKKLVQAGWPLAPERLGDMSRSLKELWTAAQESAALSP